MKTKIILIVGILLPLLMFSQSSSKQFKWGIGSYSKNFDISCLNNQRETFYFLMDNYIKIISKPKQIKIEYLKSDTIYSITPDNSGKSQKITKIEFNNSEITKISDSIYCIKPNKIGKSQKLIINNDTILFDVKEITEDCFSINFSNSTSPFSDCISKDDLLKSKSFDVEYNFKKYRITNLYMFFEGKNETGYCYIGDNGDLSTSWNDKDTRKHIFENSYLEIFKLKIQLPDNKEISLGFKKLMIVDNYKNEFARRTIKTNPYTSDFKIWKNDLRIKIKGNPKKEDIKTINEIINELNQIIGTEKIQIVDKQPSVILEIDSIKAADEALYEKINISKIDNCYKDIRNNFFFPFRTVGRLHFDTKVDSSERKYYLRKCIVDLLGNFNKNGIDSSIFGESNNSKLCSYDKYLIKTLYSPDGDYAVHKIIDKDFDYPDRNAAFLLTIVLIVVLLFVFFEIYHYYGFNFIIDKIKFKIARRIVESLLISLIPAIAIIILLSEKLISGDFHEVGLCFYFEKFIIPFSILIGVLFLAIDGILSKIKKIWIAIILNFILSFFSIWLAYQIIYLFISPEFISLSVVGWKIMLIPFIITLYRIYSRFQANKISGLLQEKELELAKQKELKFKSDLNALQARINPHFLYNALNSLASLAYIDAERTEKMALSLSKLFRYNINKEDEHFSSIKDEIEMAQIYLDIEKNRFEEKLEYSIDVQNSLLDFNIPKFILQPLTENAVKHGISKITSKGIIKINIFEEEQKVMIEIYDNGPEFPDGLISGYGLQNTYEKFKLLYKKPFEIEFINKPEKKLVIILTK